MAKTEIVQPVKLANKPIVILHATACCHTTRFSLLEYCGLSSDRVIDRQFRTCHPGIEFAFDDIVEYISLRWERLFLHVWSCDFPRTFSCQHNNWTRTRCRETGQNGVNNPWPIGYSNRNQENGAGTIKRRRKVAKNGTGSETIRRETICG